jgi:hypothetical protein
MEATQLDQSPVPEPSSVQSTGKQDKAGPSASGKAQKPSKAPADTFNEFLQEFHNVFTRQDSQQLHILYETRWHSLLDKAFKSTPLPSAETVAPLVHNGFSSSLPDTSFTGFYMLF